MNPTLETQMLAAGHGAGKRYFRILVLVHYCQDTVSSPSWLASVLGCPRLGS